MRLRMAPVAAVIAGMGVAGVAWAQANASAPRPVLEEQRQQERESLNNAGGTLNAGRLNVDVQGGDLTKDGTLNSLTNKVAHFVAGCAGGVLNAGNSGGCAAGGIGAAIGELTAETIGRGTNGVPSNWTDNNTVYLSGLLGGLAVALAGGDQEQIATANWAGSNAAANNRLAHYDEHDRIRVEAAGDKELEARLNRAACFEIKCWVQYPEGSELYNENYVSAVEASGLTKELEWVQEQKQFGYFRYASFEKAIDKWASVTGLSDGSLNGRLIDRDAPAAGGCFIEGCADRVAGVPKGINGIPDGMYTVGISGAAPFLGSIRVGAGVSFSNGQRQYGVAIDNPILGIGIDKLFLNKWGVDFAYQTGTFESNNGSIDQAYRGGWGLWGRVSHEILMEFLEHR